MSTNKTVLISLIGKGSIIEESKGYRKAKYYFNETQDVVHTSFFGSALYEILIKQGYEIDKWLIFGTSKSNWSELLHVVDEKYHDEMIELYDTVYDIEKDNKEIPPSLLLKWQETLQNYISGIRLILVSPKDYEIYIDHMINEIPNDKRNIVLDITHAFRHMPVIIAFSLMALKHIKDISKIMVYYGAFELKENRFDNEEPTPVLNIDFINKLVSYGENLAIFSNSGYFPNILEDLDISGTDETYFWIEMNRQPRKDLESINERLYGKIIEKNHQSKIAEYIKREMEPLIGASLHRRMVERARFFFEKKQYLKSLILLYEGLIIAIGRKHGIESGQDYENNQKIREYIRDNKRTIFKDKKQMELYYNLEYTRNAAVHGARSRGIQNYVEQQEQFETLFKSGLEIYEYITGEGLC